jgi:general secretion pathway protein G
MNTKRHRRRIVSSRGFTLIEMIAVLVIIGMMVGFGAIYAQKQIEAAKVTEAKAQTKTMASALGLYAMNCGNYPKEEQGLDALLTRPPDADGWLGPYLTDWVRIPKDPWKNAYEYKIITDEDGEDQIQVISWGKDGKPGGSGKNADVISGQIIEEADGDI